MVRRRGGGGRGQRGGRRALRDVANDNTLNNKRSAVADAEAGAIDE